MSGHFVELFQRYEGNPILTATDWPYPANSVFNPGATLLPSGETLLLVRVEDRRGMSHLTVARSADGFTNWKIDPAPTMTPDPVNYPEEEWGIEDPRVTWIPELNEYLIAYTAFSTSGPLVALARTADFKTIRRIGAVFPPEDKDAALFPRRFKGEWALIHRPIGSFPAGMAHIWISFSENLRHWGENTVLLRARRGAWWDSNKIGLSPPPLETPEGWLLMYHGVRITAGGCLYRLGLALLDLEDPTQVIRRADEWFFRPEEPYERVGDVGDVVFPCGWTLDQATGQIRMYYGASDTVVAMATAQLSDVLAWMPR